MNDDLIPPMEPEDVCAQVGHDWYAMVDQYGKELAECRRCKVLLEAA